MASDYVICVRNIKRGKFGTEPGPTRFLKVPPGELPHKDHQTARTHWVEEVTTDAQTGIDPVTNEPTGDLLVFVHGFNNGQDTVMKRHRQLRKDLGAIGYKGAVVSYDWPSAESALNYLEDRSDAKQTALRLVTDCIVLFSHRQSRGCQTNVHLLAHSTGAYVVREAFDDADDRPRVAATNWTASQVMLISADVSQKSTHADNAKSSSLFRHSVRITNYSNPHDSALKLSNIKRVGVAPRAGRIGLSSDAPRNCVNVNCGRHFESLNPRAAIHHGQFDHSWQIGDPTFAADVLHTIRGDIDRHEIPTRRRLGDELHMKTVI